MPQIARQRSRLAVLAVLALVGSLLAVSAVPAVAAMKDGKASHPATQSACVGAASMDAGFTDTAMTIAEDAANCLAHYGITTGTSAGNFSPNDAITRAQMAVFMMRAGGPAGVVAPDMMDDMGMGYADIGGYPMTIQNAIKQVSDLGIMTGTSATEFSPDGYVNRADMAVILDAFLTNALPGPGAFYKLDGKYKDLETDDRPFTDIGEVPYSAFLAIHRIYEVGVTAGTGMGHFSPDALVSRAQMAVFVTAALDHTNARPAGLSMQPPSSVSESKGTVSVDIAYRNADHSPAVDESIDVFSVGSSKLAKAFKFDGTCDSANVMGVEGSSTTCVVGDGDDLVTDEDGNAAAVLAVPENADVDSSMTVWAWTGDLGAKFDNDTTDALSAEISIIEDAQAVMVTDDMKTHANRVPFGDPVTVTFQLIDGEGQPVAEADRTLTFTSVSGFTSTRTTEDGEPEGPASAAVTIRTHDLKTDSSGKAEFIVAGLSDPSATKRGDGATTLLFAGTVTQSVTRSATGVPRVSGVRVLDSGDELGGLTVHTKPNWNGDRTDRNPVRVDWSDGLPVASTLTLSQTSNHHSVPTAENSGPRRHTVRAMLVDQYGEPVSGARVRISGDTRPGSHPEPSSLDGTPEVRTTNRSGVASKSYTWTSMTTGFDNITAEVVALDDDGAYQPISPAVGVDADMAMRHYWTSPVDPGEGCEWRVLAVDTDNNTLILRGTDGVEACDHVNTFRTASYGSGDQFRSGATALALANFEKELDPGDHVRITLSPATSDNPSVFILMAA